MELLVIGVNHFEYLSLTRRISKLLKKFKPEAVLIELPKNLEKELILNSKYFLGSEMKEAAVFSVKNKIDFYFIDCPMDKAKEIFEWRSRLSLKLVLSNIKILTIKLFGKLLFPLIKFQLFLIRLFMRKKYAEIISRVNKDSSKKLLKRDKYMAREIKFFLKKYKRVAVVVGASHLDNLEKLLCSQENFKVTVKKLGHSIG